MSFIEIITDNEWQGKYYLLEQEYKRDNIETIISLGDNLPTGTIKTVGKKSFFKTTIKELIKQNPDVKKLSLEEQMKLVYNTDPEQFKANYGIVHEYIRQGVEFLKNSSLPIIKSIPGNREHDIQPLLDMIAGIMNIPNLDYNQELMSTGKFEMVTTPQTELYESTGVLFIPYTSKPEVKPGEIEERLDELNDMKPEEILMLTHENPSPESIGMDRKAKTQDVLDAYITDVAKMQPQALMVCGHLDKTAPAFSYRGISVLSLSGRDIMQYDTTRGAYTVIALPGTNTVSAE